MLCAEGLDIFKAITKKKNGASKFKWIGCVVDM